MDRRMVLAIALMLAVAVVPSILFPPKARQRPTTVVSDTGTTLSAESLHAGPPDTAPTPLPPVARTPASPNSRAPAVPRVVVSSPLYRIAFSTRGARMVEATLKDYRSFMPGDTGRVQLMPPDSRFLDYALLFGQDTVSLADWVFTPSDSVVDVAQPGTSFRMTSRRGPVEVTLTYTFSPDQYLFDVNGRVKGIDARGVVLVELGPRLRSVEADSSENVRAYKIVTKAGRTESVAFSSLDPGETQALDGPFEWVALKSKYFVVAVMSLTENGSRFGGATATGGPRLGKLAINADVRASLPLPTGAFRHEVYVGPQEYRRLARIGHEFEDINPYGWVLRPVIQPFANLIVRILLWMHENLALQYGWVLVLFGIAVRVLMWPLQQKAMRSSMAMQAIQPEIKALQARLKNDPQKMQQEVMKLYKEHNVNPLGGCLPLLIPMPVLFALFFVFRETIEFRGVPFLWLPDLSRADPYYIIPILMGLSMYAVTRLGQMGLPPNPQAKMMRYVMPGFMTLIFLRFSSGLNLYYAVSNIVSIPQQWLIARERLKRSGGES